jgi:hypothetical protein
MFADSQVFSSSLPGFASQLSPQKTSKDENRTICLPVTAKMLHESSAGDAAYLSGGRENSMLILVGQVEALTSGPACVEFTLSMAPALEAARQQLLDAGIWGQVEGLLLQKTGEGANKIKVRKYITDGKKMDVAEGQFVVVTGEMRAAPELHMSASFLNTTENTKRIGFHMIEALHALLRITRGPPPKSSSSPATFATPEKHSNRQLIVPTASPMATASPAVSASPAAPAANTTTSPATAAAPTASAPAGGLRETLLRVLKENSDDMQGFTAAALSQKIGRASESDVKACLAALTDEGEIFNTVDDDHYSAL